MVVQFLFFLAKRDCMGEGERGEKTQLIGVPFFLMTCEVKRHSKCTLFFFLQSCLFCNTGALAHSGIHALLLFFPFYYLSCFCPLQSVGQQLCLKTRSQIIHFYFTRVCVGVNPHERVHRSNRHSFFKSRFTHLFCGVKPSFFFCFSFFFCLFAVFLFLF